MRIRYRIDLFSSEQGDSAVCFGYGPPEEWRIVVYDGGTPEIGKELLAHIRTQYGTEVVDDVVCSHPHFGQASGLQVLLENLQVRRLWMHRPWAYSATIARHLQAGLSGVCATEAQTSDGMTIAHALEELAAEKNIPVSEPFQGARIGPFTVMSPHRDWYVHSLIPEMEVALPPRRSMSPEVDYLLQRSGIRLDEQEIAAVHESNESNEEDVLQEGGVVAAVMESSVVLFGAIDGQGILLTGNAGVKALSNTVNCAEHEHLSIQTRLRFVQIPRHGDRSHLSPSILDRLIGPAAPSDITAFIATPHESSYPHRSVIEALARRGTLIVHAQGKSSYSCDYNPGEGIW